LRSIKWQVKMAEFLFEIFCEEIPARIENEHCYTGPRRLVFTADIPLRSPDISEERKGPRVGSPEQALAGFMRGAGISDISEAEIRTDPKKGEYYVAVIEKSGEDSASIIAELIPSIMNNFPWPKSMKSGRSSFRWVRPLTSMVCVLDGKMIDFEVGGVSTGNTTEGHRRHGKGPYKVKNFADYRKILESKGHVMVCSCERKAKILADARKACADKGLELVEDEGLLNEVAGLAEWPVVILGDMDPSFLELPGEVIRLSMRTHQKYFAVRDPKTGNLAPNFIVVANQEAPDGGVEIVKGNSKVLSARLADAKFFQSEDAKKKLIDYYNKLDTVVFHKKLGSIRDKAERVAALARELAPKVGANPDAAEQASKLAKCDLVTNMVVEFTSLQGQIGAQMYRREHSLLSNHPREGGDPESASGQDGSQLGSRLRGNDEECGAADHADIAVAIEEHYKPQGPSDGVPTNPVAVAVALADKLDTLVGFWAIDEKPTGSKDPFALRRAALGVVRIVLKNKVDFGFCDFDGADDDDDLGLLHILSRLFEPILKRRSQEDPEFDKSLEIYLKPMEETGLRAYKLAGTNDLSSCHARELAHQLFEFMVGRLEVLLRDQGKRHDLVAASLAFYWRNTKIYNDNIVDIVSRVEALQFFLDTSDGENLLAGYKRAANILKAEDKKGDLPTGAPKKPSITESAALYAALQKAAPAIDTALQTEAYASAMKELSQLRAPIDAFFTHVQVISDDTAVKENNLRWVILCSAHPCEGRGWGIVK